jgi:hypothetical protein
MDIIDTKLIRWEIYKFGVLTGDGLLAAKRGFSIRNAGAADMVSSRTTLWTEPLSMPSPLSPRSNLRKHTAYYSAA